jgi:HlyD family secretion protein
MFRLVFICLTALVLAGCSALPTPGAQEAPVPTPAPVTQTDLVIADATVLPAAEVTLSFEQTGAVVELLVAEGDPVEAGQPLARLDSRQLELRVEEARTNLARAEARFNQAAAGADPAAVAVAQAGVTQAQAGLNQARAEVSQADLAAAEAQLAEARAALAGVLEGAQRTEVAQAQAAVDQANANLQQQRDALSAAKTTAQLSMEQSANRLREQQQAYQRVYWDNRDLERLPGDLPDERIDLEATALREVQNAEAQLEQARVAFAQAQQAEAEGIAVAEAGVRDAQARLEQLTAAPANDRVAAAQARVAAAEANLNRLRGPTRATQIDVAAAGVTQAQAALEQAASGPRDVDLAVAQVEITAAQVALRQAELNLSQATLVAPITGVVAQLDLTVGAVAPAGAPALILADLSSWRVETADLTELDVVRMREGDTVTVRFDALPELELPGIVQRIRPIGANRQGDIVYTVVVTLEESDPRLRWNMTAVVEATGQRYSGEQNT